MKNWKLSKLWPQVPIGLLMLLSGATNILTGSKIRQLGAAYQSLSQVGPFGQLSRDLSLGTLGNGVQVLLGAGMLIVGVALFWRLRSAWAFAILVLCAALTVDMARHRAFSGLIAPGASLMALIAWQKRFAVQSLAGAYLMSFLGLAAVLAYGILGSLLLGAEFKPPILDLATAIYFTVTSITTAGCNIYPATPEAKFYVVGLIVAGLSTFMTTVVATLGPLLSNQLRGSLIRKKTAPIQERGGSS
jgi:voltage-gated potassium channel